MLNIIDSGIVVAFLLFKNVKMITLNCNCVFVPAQNVILCLRYLPDRRVCNFKEGGSLLIRRKAHS